jgi:hypothetical protein
MKTDTTKDTVDTTEKPSDVLILDVPCVICGGDSWTL